MLNKRFQVEKESGLDTSIVLQFFGRRSFSNSIQSAATSTDVRDFPSTLPELWSELQLAQAGVTKSPRELFKTLDKVKVIQAQKGQIRWIPPSISFLVCTSALYLL